MTSPIIKLVMIGEYSIFRGALRMLLETDPKFRVIGEAKNPESALQIIYDERPDLILVDLPDNDVAKLLPLLKDAELPVLLLIDELDVEIYKQCLRIGIRGLVLKQERADTLFKAIEKIHAGEIWFDRIVMGDTIRHLIGEMQMLHSLPLSPVASALTDREREVIGLICKGMKNKEIAESLFISETTVRHHLTSIFNKLDITSRLELVVYAFENNLVKKLNESSFYPMNGYARNTTDSLGA